MVLASGAGTTLQALLDVDGGYPATVVAVGADRVGIPALNRARAAGVPTFVVSPGEYPDRTAWDGALAAAVAAYEPGLVVCAGFMRILGSTFLDLFHPLVLNTHPALLPAFPGAHAVRDALAYGVTVTGATVHVVDEGVDTGPVLAQAVVAVEPGDDEATLHARIQAVERRLLVDTVASLAGGFHLHGRKVVRNVVSDAVSDAGQKMVQS